MVESLVEFTERVYSKLKEINEIERKKQEILKIAKKFTKELEINIEECLEIDNAKGIVSIKFSEWEINNESLREKIEDVVKYLTRDGYIPSRTLFVITTEELEKEKLEKGEFEEVRSQKLGLTYLGFKRLANGDYADIYKLDNKIYMIIESTPVDDC